MSDHWRQRQREFQARVVLDPVDRADHPVSLLSFRCWEVPDEGRPPERSGWVAALVVQVGLIAVVAVAVGLLVGMGAGSDLGATTAMAIFIGAGMIRVFTAALGVGVPGGLPSPAPGSYVALWDGDPSTVCVARITTADRIALGDEGTVAVVGEVGAGCHFGLVSGARMAWPVDPPVSAGP